MKAHFGLFLKPGFIYLCKCGAVDPRHITISFCLPRSQSLVSSRQSCIITDVSLAVLCPVSEVLLKAVYLFHSTIGSITLKIAFLNITVSVKFLRSVY